MTDKPADPSTSSTSPAPATDERASALARYTAKLREHKELEAKVKKRREELQEKNRAYDKTEDDLKAIQNVGQIIGEVLTQLDEERFIVKASSGPRYVVGCRRGIVKERLKASSRVSLDMTTLTIMRHLPREVDPSVYHMLHEDPGQVSYNDIGGLSEQIRELRETIELPLTNPQLFDRVGIKPPKGVLLYGPPGTGKTLLARAMARSMDVSFMKIVASAIVDKYIGESSRVIREMFGCVFFYLLCFVCFFLFLFFFVLVAKKKKKKKTGKHEKGGKKKFLTGIFVASIDTDPGNGVVDQ
jgi:26S proteasome regulatory subunit T4